MFNLGFSEIVLLGIIALIFIGPQQLPEVARTIARFLNELKRASNDFQDTFTSPLKEDIQNRLQEVRTTLKEEATLDLPPGSTTVGDKDKQS